MNSSKRFCKKCCAETERRSDGGCKPCANAYSAAWRTNNREKSLFGKTAYRKENKEKIKESAALYRAANSEVEAARNAAWASANSDACRIRRHNRLARERANGGRLSPGLAAKLFKLQRGKCACCHVSIEDGNHMDHRIPVALGGPNEDWNIQLLCAPCNLSKGAKHPVEFMQQRGFLL